MTTSATDRGATRTVYDVRGMDCAECARSVATAVERLPGVSSASVNFGAGTLIVEAEASSRVDLAPKVLRAVEVAGYRAISREGRRASDAPSFLADRRSQLAIASPLVSDAPSQALRPVPRSTITNSPLAQGFSTS